MKLVIHDLYEEEWSKVSAEYEGWKVISDNGTIKPCAGCFGCWLRTPGECVIKDGYECMGKLIHEAEEVVIMSRYTYGGFSSFVKNVMDRSIGYIQPYFRFYKGEMHHKPRYKEHKPLSFIFRGEGLTESEKKSARQYVEAVTTNFNAVIKEVRFDEVQIGQVEEDKANTVAKEKVTIPGKTIYINGSPKGDNANSKKLMEVLTADIEDAEIINISAYYKKMDELVDMIRSAEKVVFSMPLYVDGIPAPIVRLMEKLEKEIAGSGKKVYVIANMGFYENSQIRNLLAMMKAWCDKAGLAYCGGIAIGAGGMIGQIIHYGSHGPGQKVYESLVTLKEIIAKSEATSDIYTGAYKFPRIVYFMICNSRMKKSFQNN